MIGKKRNKIPLWAALIAALFCTLAGACSEVPGALSQPQSQTPAASGKAAALATETQVYFLNVGQGDCELIRLKSGETVLIDSGTGETAVRLTAYLIELGISRIDFLIATHPHEDHIGGMTQVIQSFEIGKIMMPKIADSQVPTTAVYEKLLKAIQKKEMKIDAPRGGEVLLQNGDEKLEVFAPNSSKYGSLNSYSIVTKLTCGEKSFLFTGDAESDSEKEMIAKGYDLKSDVLKCGHHGSSTSTSAAFLKAVNPGTAVISCGVNNDYGHPDKTVLNRLEKAKVPIYRTDKQGTVLAQCDGKSIRFTTGLASVVQS